MTSERTILDGAGEFPDNFHNALFSALDGATYTLDGISGVIAWHTFLARYPYAHWVSSLYHRPDSSGRATAAYGAVREQLGDDWDSDLTTSDRLIAIAIDVIGLAAVETLDRQYSERRRNA